MKTLALRILKIFLICTTLILILSLVVGATLFFNWPLWVAGFILMGLLGVGIAALVARKFWLKRREQRFVTQIIDQDEAYLKQMASQDQQHSRELQDRWREAINALRNSHLKRHGNPLYVLPWYMIIGESGSGKTTAIQSAQLSSPFAEVSRTSGISGTRNCDWWFFEKAILIDTAGRYAMPIDEGRDKEEWQKFLTLLTRYRKKESLNGLVVTIAANKLLESPAEALENDGKSIRRRIDELMRVLGTKFPVYVLVTKCDLVQGMSQFCDQLPAKGLAQAMGVLNRSLSAQAAEFLEHGLKTVEERLRDYRLLLFHRPGEAGASATRQRPEPALLLFPEEFERLKGGLAKFIASAFQPNPYQETPVLRGLFFSSGRQEGRPYSHFLKELGLISEREMLPGTNRGLFLHEFFTRILPADRRLFVPTQRALSWNRFTKSLGLTAWLAIGIAFCGLLSFSFVTNLKTFSDVSKTFQLEAMKGDLVPDVNILADFQKRLESLQRQSRSWWIGHFGLRHNERVEAALRDRYCQRFQTGLLGRLDQQMHTSINQFSTTTPDQVIGDHAIHLVDRILLLKARVQGEEIESLKQKRLSVAPPIQAQVDRVILPSVQDTFNRLNAIYLDWSTDRDQLNREMVELQKRLNYLVTDRRTDMHWLVEWTNQRSGLPAVTLSDFWPALAPGPGMASVAPAYSEKGKETIDGFILDLQTALGESFSAKLSRIAQEFQAWYRRASLQAWANFGEAFIKVPGLLKGQEALRQTASRMGADQSPYFQVIDRMAAELKPLAGETDLPPWLQRVFEFSTAKQMAAFLDAAGSQPAGILQKAADQLKAKAAQLDKTKAETSEVFAAGKGRLNDAQSLKDYQKQVSAAAGAAASRETAYQAAVVMYKEDPATSQSPMHQAWKAANAFKTGMPGIKADPKFFWDLVYGPLEYLKVFFSEEAACHLQGLWEKDVLLQAQGITDKNELIQMLLEPQGLARKFIGGPGAPFVDQSLARGYYAKRVQGVSLPFIADFFTFMNRGPRVSKPLKDSYAVTMEGLPTSANPEARIQPGATLLELKCADKRQILINRNYPIRQTFTWSPQTCGDVVFHIEVGNLLLARHYSGSQGFARFLQEFYSGDRTFIAEDFPGERAALQSLGIRFIQVKYMITGHEPVVQLLSVTPTRVPTLIVQCLDR
ncbi:MAG TPA: type VI secretion system protein ImpL [Syntrophobacteraceae bacterium]|nr:type VI secretion system protein ImpL [Syntrophobacteraceae bacterium]